MKRAYFVWLFQFWTTTFLLSQANPVLSIDQSARAAAPISAFPADPKAHTLRAGPEVPVRWPGFSIGHRGRCK